MGCSFAIAPLKKGKTEIRHTQKRFFLRFIPIKALPEDLYFGSCLKSNRWR